MDSDIRIGRDVPTQHRGPHALVTLGGFAALVAGFMAVVAGLVGLAWLLQRLG